jgi:outer membrane protein OmpA-like peptidoglycan-associated protein
MFYGAFMKNIVLYLLLLITTVQLAYSKDELTISGEFNLFTSKNAQGYFKPLSTTLSESFNSDYYTTANYHKSWSLGLDVSFMELFIPSSQLTYNAELPQGFSNRNLTNTADLRDNNLRINVPNTSLQPTFYGGHSTPVFSTPLNSSDPDSLLRTVTFMEGNNISQIVGVPALQLFVGLPTRTQLRIRYFGVNVGNYSVLSYGIGVNQNIDKFFDIFPEEMGLALNLAYNSFAFNPGFNINSLAAGLHYSYSFDFGLTLYCGAQYESTGGHFKAVREITPDQAEYVNSPFEEIRDRQDLDFDITSSCFGRLTGGLSYKIGFLELHADAAYAAQPIVTAGLSFWFFDTYKAPEKPVEPEPIALLESPNIQKAVPKTSNVPIEAPIVDVGKDVKVDAVKQKTPVAVPIVKDELDVSVIGIDNGVEKEIDAIQIEEFRSRQVRPVLPYVFFDHNTAEIPRRYILLDNMSVNLFSLPQSLSGKGIMGTYYNVLNIIGERLNLYPQATITLTGCNSNIDEEKGNLNLSEQRAKVVSDYLVNVWKVDMSRITIVKRALPLNESNVTKEDGIAENRRVEIAASDYRVVEPIFIEDTLRKVFPPILKFTTTNKLTFQEKKWSIDAMSNDRFLESYAGTELLNVNRLWNINQDQEALALIKNNIQYIAKAENKDKDKFASSTIKVLPVQLTSLSDKEKRKTMDTLVNVYNLILFDFDQPQLNSNNKKIADFINTETPTDAIVSVTGYTDRIGEDAYNLNLSTQRAKYAAAAIKAKEKKYRGAGESELLYDNDLPEGRFYCRTVQIVVKYIDK